MKKMRKQVKGVTLIEVMLVAVIISVVLIMAMGYIQQKALQTRFDKSAAQIQQVLNAALAYYMANNSTWPAGPTIDCLRGVGCPVQYLPSSINNPVWPGATYWATSLPGRYLIATAVIAPAGKTYGYATTIAGMLPVAYTSDLSLDANGVWTQGTCTPATATCYVVAMVTAPGQNLNNATAVNFASLYHSGACVPVPTCPVAANGTPMTASIVVVPASVTGVYDKPTGGASCNPTNLSGCSVNAYPLNSFTATATGPSAAADVGPPDCSTGVKTPCYASYDASGNPVGAPLTGQYWRVCLSVLTERGAVTPNSGSAATDNAWGQLSGNVMAITRCILQGENSGSGFTVWSQ